MWTCRANGGDEIKSELDEGASYLEGPISVAGIADGSFWVGRVRSENEKDLKELQGILEKKHGWEQIQSD
jgi:hypothetical protein